MTLEGIDTILRTKGYPSRDDLRNFPLSKMLLQLDGLAWTSTGRAVELFEKENPNSRDLGKDEQELAANELEDRLREQERILGNEKIAEVYRHHIKYVIKACVLLTTNAYYRILERSDVWSLEPFSTYGQFLQSKNGEGLLGPADSYFRKFLRFAALYHDIGKTIHRERHGLLGKHLLETLSEEETKELRTLLRYEGDDYFPLLIELIGHHDLFGMLCTGEASRPVLLDALRLKDPGAILGFQATMNIADIFSTLRAKNLRMDLRIFQTVLEDWKFMVDRIEEEKQREPILFQTSMEKTVLFYSQQREYSAERIRRILVSAIFMITEIKSIRGTKLDQRDTEDAVNRMMQKLDKKEEPVTVQELKWLAAKAGRTTSKSRLEKCIKLLEQEKNAGAEIAEALREVRGECAVTQDDLKVWAKKITTEVVLDSLRKRLGPRLTGFCDSFVLICKFNYFLRFIQMLVVSWIGQKAALFRTQRQCADPRLVFEEIDVRELTGILVEILARLVENYQDLTYVKGQCQRRIGIELLGVTRSPALSEQLIELLLSDREAEGVNWLADEATAWYFG